MHDWDLSDPSKAPSLSNPVDLFEDWHKVDLRHVLMNVENLCEYASTDEICETILQDLHWTYTAVMKAIVDPELRQHVHDTLAPLVSEYKFSGPVVLYIILHRVSNSSQEVLYKVKEIMIYKFRPSDVPGQNITKFNAVVLKVSSFLVVRGIVMTDAPWRILRAYKDG